LKLIWAGYTEPGFQVLSKQEWNIF